LDHEGCGLQREIEVVRLRTAGHSFAAIAEQVGYSHKSAARKAFDRACDRQLGAAVDDYLIANMWDFLGPTIVTGMPSPPDASPFCEYAAAQRVGQDAPPYCTPWMALVDQWWRECFMADPPTSGKASAKQTRMREQHSREDQALTLLRAGYTFDAIADELGWRHRSSAWQAVNRALEGRLHEHMVTYLNQEVTRLERLYNDSWMRATTGSLRKAGDYLRVIDKREALLAPRPRDVRFQHLPELVLLRIMTAEQWLDNRGSGSKLGSSHARNRPVHSSVVPCEAVTHLCTSESSERMTPET
jgi:hypothetical protein